jgi:hypothetical protein
MCGVTQHARGTASDARDRATRIDAKRRLEAACLLLDTDAEQRITLALVRESSMRFPLSSSLVAATFIVTSLTSTDPVSAAPTAHVLRFATAEEVATLNPDINQQLVVGYLDQMTAAYAFRLDQENRLTPELATVVPTTRNGGISADGKTITLHLRQHVKWSDGVAFDADDVAFTISAINNSANLVPSRDGDEPKTNIRRSFISRLRTVRSFRRSSHRTAERRSCRSIFSPASTT